MGQSAKFIKRFLWRPGFRSRHGVTPHNQPNDVKYEMPNKRSEATPPLKTANGLSEDFESTAFGRKTPREYLEQALQNSSAGNPDPDSAVRRIAKILD